jgi:HK97 gp10 family phage protein
MAFELRVGRVTAAQAGDRAAALLALKLRNEAVRRCPVDTGRLRQSIGLQKVGDGHYRVGTNVVYAPYVEFGTRRARAQPFMRPALEAVRGG